MKSIVAAQCLVTLQDTPIEHKLVALDQSGNVRLLGWMWRLRFHRASAEINHIERCVDVQGSRLTVGTNAILVEQAISCIARLLDLGDQ